MSASPASTAVDLDQQSASTSSPPPTPGPSFRARLLHHRLQADLDDIFSFPLPAGLTVVADPANDPAHFCVHILPPRGSFKGRKLHFDVEIPEDWPRAAPIIIGGSWLKISRRQFPASFWLMRRVPDDKLLLQARNWTPSQTLHKTIISLYEYCCGSQPSSIPLSLIRPRTTQKVAAVTKANIVAAEQELNTFQCEWCSFDGREQASPPTIANQLSSGRNSTGAPLNLSKFTDLPYDLVAHICEGLPTESLLALCEAYEGFHRSFVASSTYLARQLIQCHYLRTSTCHPSSHLSVIPPTISRAQSYIFFPSAPSTSKLPILELPPAPIPSLQAKSGRSPRQVVLGITASWTYYSTTGRRHLASDHSLVSSEAFFGDYFHQRRDAAGKRVDFFLALPFGVTSSNIDGQESRVALRKVWKSWSVVGRRIRSVGGSEQACRKGLNLASSPRGRGRVYQTDKTIDTITELMSASLSGFFEAHFGQATRRRRLLSANPSRADPVSDIIQSYWRLHATLVLLAQHEAPRILDLAKSRLSAFVNDIGNARSKRGTPDLHELLALVTVLATIDPQHGRGIWRTLAPVFLTEFFTRTVHDVLLAEPTLEIRDDRLPTSKDFRLVQTFVLCRKDLMVLMFQVQFLDAILKNTNHTGVFEGIGPGFGYIDFPPISVARKMRQEVNDITSNTVSWQLFFDKIHVDELPAFGAGSGPTKLNERAFAAFLRTAIVLSGRKRYHRPAGRQPRTQKERVESCINRAPGRTTPLSEAALRSQRWWVEWCWWLALVSYQQCDGPSTTVLGLWRKPKASSEGGMLDVARRRLRWPLAFFFGLVQLILNVIFGFAVFYHSWH